MTLYIHAEIGKCDHCGRSGRVVEFFREVERVGTAIQICQMCCLEAYHTFPMVSRTLSISKLSKAYHTMKTPKEWLAQIKHYSESQNRHGTSVFLLESDIEAIFMDGVEMGMINADDIAHDAICDAIKEKNKIVISL